MGTNNYAHPDVLVSTDWALEHLNDRKIRFVEVDVDTKQYDKSHIEGAIGWNWQTQLQDQVRRDILSKDQLSSFLSEAGVTEDTTLVLYGDNNNWFAAYAFWLLKYYGHKDVRLINGGRKKWVAEGKPLTEHFPIHPATVYKVTSISLDLRASREYVMGLLNGAKRGLVDVRSPDEFIGRIIAPLGMSETAQRGGHIPGAKNIPWSQAVNEDGTFKAREDLLSLYGGKGISNELKVIVTYCRIGERSSHSWFVLKYLLGFPDVRNYDGSWTEWGNLINAPIEREV
ncbi:MAG TPA: sulfurtransferase [Bacteroidota bacterium]|nr:sulfurtransferase [Bacteroidota bacterium]